jgi:phosphoglycolate phosphatase-like HAD superfamily hydrolase
MKKLIVFDLDGTLARSKSSLDDEMSALLCNLLGMVKVASFPPAERSSFTTQAAGKRCIRKISLPMKKKRSSVP